MRSPHFPLLVTCTLFAGIDSSAQSWTQTIAPTNYYSAIASSADGTKLVAVTGGGDSSGPIYLSTNSGTSWTSTNLLRDWASVASSADGTKLFAGESGGSIYISTNSGASWTNPPLPTGYNWRSIACSADGTRLIAALFGQGVAISTNTGQTWFLTIASNVSWGCTASSADGNTLAVGREDSSFLIYTSTNAGITWTTNKLGFYCMGIACSADGRKMAAACLANCIYISTNSGTTWTLSHAPNPLGWSSIASSADGTRLVAVENNGSGGQIYTSTDSGVDWTSNNVPSETWNYAASSADGGQLVAVAAELGYIPGPIFISQTPIPPKLNVANSNGTLGISWLVPSTNFVLQSSTNLGANLWSTQTNVPVLDLTNLHDQIQLAPTNGGAFFRLSTP